MDEMNIINEIVTTVLDDRTDLKIQIAYSDDLYRDALRVCENETYLEHLKGLPQHVKTEMRSAKGAYILPKDLDSRQFILISQAQKEDGFSHLTTIASEVLHAKNHTIFCEKYCGGDINQIAAHQYYRAFQIWNEFDTRRTSHRLYLSLVLQQLGGYSPADITNLLQQNELPVRLQEINGLLTEKNSVVMYQKLASILGIFHVWESGYDISIAPHMNMWVYTLFEALKKYDDIEQLNFAGLDKEIQDLWMQHMS